jgi:fructose-1-phosphate kinase PfkB-like protein
MVAALAYGEVKHLSFRDSFRLAIAASAAAVTMEGSKVADLPQIQSLLSEVHVEDL